MQKYMNLKRLNKTSALLIILIIYILAIGTGYVLLEILPFSSMINMLMADIGATILVFIFSVLLKNSSVYDPYWSVIPPFIAVYLTFIHPEGNTLRQYVILGLILIWAIRLTANWARGWSGLDHEDWRYQKIASDTGRFYWPVSFIGIHLMPTLFVFAGCLPLWFTLESQVSFNLLDLLATLITLLAILVEWIADEQLKNFKKGSSGKAFMDGGLWSMMRHPNYLGEILFWTGLFLFVVSSNSLAGWWTGAGFVSMIILFNFISIPLMEKRNLENRSGYDKYMQEVNALLPIRKRGNKKIL
jgi:steroid 5-alpha reductase family enzyme